MVIFVVGLVGFSRIALGAHYLSDVLGGIFLGGTWLTVCVLVTRPFRRWVLPPVIVDALTEPIPELMPVPVENALLVPVEQTAERSL